MLAGMLLHVIEPPRPVDVAGDRRACRQRHREHVCEVIGVDNMIYVKSTNANDGTMSIRVDFAVGTDIDMDNVLTQNRVSQANATLPSDVKNYGVTIKKSLGMPMVLFSLYSPTGAYDAQFLGNYATININDALARIEPRRIQPAASETPLLPAA